MRFASALESTSTPFKFKYYQQSKRGYLCLSAGCIACSIGNTRPGGRGVLSVKHRSRDVNPPYFSVSLVVYNLLSSGQLSLPMPSKYETADPIYKNAVSFLYGVRPSLDKPSSDSTVKMYPSTSVRISATCHSDGGGVKEGTCNKVST